MSVIGVDLLPGPKEYLFLVMTVVRRYFQARRAPMWEHLAKLRDRSSTGTPTPDPNGWAVLHRLHPWASLGRDGFSRAGEHTWASTYNGANLEPGLVRPHVTLVRLIHPRALRAVPAVRRHTKRAWCESHEAADPAPLSYLPVKLPRVANAERSLERRCSFQSLELDGSRRISELSMVWEKQSGWLRNVM